MKCRKCNRTLRSPQSQQLGYGPVCFDKLFGSADKEKRKPKDGEIPEEIQLPGQISIDDWAQSLK